MPAILPPVDLVNFEYVTEQRLGTNTLGQDKRIRRLKRKTTVLSLTLDFVNNIYERNGIIYPTFVALLTAISGTFTRATTGYDRAATQSFAVNVPRVTLADGLLLEPAKTNLVSQPSSFDNAAWIKDAGVTVSANADVAPDGTTTADRVTYTNFFQKLLLNIPTGINPALTYYGSVFAKQISGPNVDVQLQIGAGATVTPLSTSAWTRALDINVIGAVATNVIIYDAGGLNPVHAYWGAQLEPNALTSYHPSSRGVDTLSMVLEQACTVTYGNDTTAVVGPGVWTPVLTPAQQYRIKSVVSN